MALQRPERFEEVVDMFTLFCERIGEDQAATLTLAYFVNCFHHDLEATVFGEEKGGN